MEDEKLEWEGWGGGFANTNQSRTKELTQRRRAWKSNTLKMRAEKITKIFLQPAGEEVELSKSFVTEWKKRLVKGEGAVGVRYYSRCRE